MKKRPDYLKIVSTYLVIGPLVWFFAFMLILTFFYQDEVRSLAWATLVTLGVFTLYVIMVRRNPEKYGAVTKDPDAPFYNLPPQSPYYKPENYTRFIDSWLMVIVGILVIGSLWLVAILFLDSTTNDLLASLQIANIVALFASLVWVFIAHSASQLHNALVAYPSWHLATMHSGKLGADEGYDGFEIAECTRCKLRSTQVEWYKTKYNLLAWPIKTEFLCPRCLEQNKMQVQYHVVWISYNLLRVAFLYLLFANFRIWVLASYGLILLFYYFNVALHELAHAIAILLTGHKVLEIKLGDGIKLFRKKILGTTISFYWGNIRSSVYPIMNPRKSTILDELIIYSSGPLVHISIVLMACMLWGPVSIINDFVTAQPAILSAFVLANMLNIPSSYGDGDSIISIIKSYRQESGDWGKHKHLSNALVLEERESAHAHYESLQEIQKLYPDDQHVWYRLGLHLEFNNKWEKALDYYNKVLNHESPDSANKAWILNNIAYKYYKGDDNNNFELAEKYSKEAYSMMPWEPAIMDTMGCVLVAAGDFEKGWPLIRRSHVEAESKESRIDTALNMAWALEKNGEPDLSREWVDVALRYAPENQEALDFKQRLDSGVE